VTATALSASATLSQRIGDGRVIVTYDAATDGCPPPSTSSSTTTTVEVTTTKAIDPVVPVFAG